MLFPFQFPDVFFKYIKTLIAGFNDTRISFSIIRAFFSLTFFFLLFCLHISFSSHNLSLPLEENLFLFHLVFFKIYFGLYWEQLKTYLLLILLMFLISVFHLPSA